MRQLLFVFAVSALMLVAQRPAPKNLKVLKPEEVNPQMRLATAGLGVKCDECHVPTDFSSDEKPMKVTARMMFEMTQKINAGFPDGKAHVTCYTCHRAQKEPLTAAPAAQ
jgi:hypothetical protein